MEGAAYGHLKDLVASTGSSNGSSDDAALLEEWLSARHKHAASTDATGFKDNHDEEIEELNTVLRIFDQPDADTPEWLTRLTSKAHLRESLPTIRDMLQSGRSNDDVSAELLDLVGYDDIELVSEMCGKRSAAASQLNEYMVLHMPSHSVIPPDIQFQGASLEGAKERITRQLEENAARPLFSGTAEAAPEVLPNVFTSASFAHGNVLSHFGSRYLLPLGTTRVQHEEYEEVTIPPAKNVAPRSSEHAILVDELDLLAKGSFPGYISLNRIQSVVYPTAYGTNENMLVCAPTGAGKTDVAMLTILRVIKQHCPGMRSVGEIKSSLNRHAFKIIYVAPMKALASEIVRKFKKRLQWLSVEVRELTGDMQLTKAEIADTQVIVTTPEKWDVVTRKPTGEGELVSSLKLLIIDEVHLLNEERGAVIETIVARTQRHVESSQSVIRIVGLSATLPNYIDVADFLCVSRYKGLFYFDSSFRPIPLEQHFLAIKGKPGSALSKKNLDYVTYQKVSELVEQGHQVMVFVHARKETVKAATTLREMAQTEGTLDDFLCNEHPNWELFRRSISESRNKEMKQLFDSGFGIHHAGMLRSDRNLMERMFEARALKVLCCTATLAWGVNLPAHAVVIKGTQVYNSAKGAFVDLSVLDVLQVFGRAGRPGLETSGEGYLCTTEDKLSHYLEAILSQNPIESQFRGGLVDALNAEISLGTVGSIRDAVQWLGYTYLFVRMRKNPFVYGLDHNTLVEDPHLGAKRQELVTLAAQKLTEANMATFDTSTGSLAITDLGRIAAKYYVRHASILIFNKEFRPRMSEADVLSMLSMSTEFDQIQVREAEVKELQVIMENIPCEVKGGTDTSQGKVNILLQAYISRHALDDFALVSDMAYCAQNGGRIVRALLEIALSRKWAGVAAVLVGLSKSIEKRLWPFDHPLKQMALKAETLYNIERWANDWEIADLASLGAAELGQLVHLNELQGQAISKATKQFPTLRFEYSLSPLAWDVLKITLTATRGFEWNNKLHGSGETFWFWVEDQNGINILQLAQATFRQEIATVDVDFFVSIPPQAQPEGVTVRAISDHWIDAQDEIEIPLSAVKMPRRVDYSRPPLDVPFLPLSSTRHPSLHKAFGTRVKYFNGIQTQVFWSLFHTRLHTLISAPTGSGKSTVVQLLCCHELLSASRDAVIIVITPSRGVTSEWASDLQKPCRDLSLSLQVIDTPEKVLSPARGRTIRIVNCALLLRSLHSKKTHDSIPLFSTVVCENLERLDANYELAISLLRSATQFSRTRYIALCSSLTDVEDLASWLHVDPSAHHNFLPRDREQALHTHTQTFTIPHSASLFKSMAKPAYAAYNASGSSPAIIFVPSRNQCRPVALDLITQCALQNVASKGFLPQEIPDEVMDVYLAHLTDRTLVDIISSGVGFFHAGVGRGDCKLMLQLYNQGVIRVLIVPRDSCWTLPVRASTVVVMGTQYVHIEQGGTGRQVRNYELTELVRMQSRAVLHGQEGHFFIFCQAESKETILRFLLDGLPLESQLLKTDTLRHWYHDARTHGIINSRQQGADALGFTLLARRAVSNPVYYGNNEGAGNIFLSRLVDTLEEGVNKPTLEKEAAQTSA